jgi:hypothetical protein
MDWIKTSERLPIKPGKRSYEHVDCLVVFKGQVFARPWNCEHECWDDEDGDDHWAEALEVTHWMPIPPLPTPTDVTAHEAKEADNG